jgi:hypothetical protein
MCPVVWIELSYQLRYNFGTASATWRNLDSNLGSHPTPTPQYSPLHFQLRK